MAVNISYDLETVINPLLSIHSMTSFEMEGIADVGFHRFPARLLNSKRKELGNQELSKM